MVAGTERVETDKINWLAEHGYEVTIVTYEQGLHQFSFPINETVCHEDLGRLVFVRRHAGGQDMLDALILDADVDDVLGILGQGHVRVGLNRQQQDQDDHGLPVGLQISKQFPHFVPLSASSFISSRTA